MADELSLLWRIRADASQVKTATAESRAAVAQLRQSFGPELTQTVSVANKAFSDIASNLNIFVGQRLPLVGGAFVRVTENIRGFGDEAKKQEGALKKVAESITDLSNRTGKSVPQLTAFLTQFAKIGTQASRDNAALKFFGAEFVANNPKLITELEKTAQGLGAIAISSEAAGAGIAAMAGPIGVAVIAVVGMVAGTLLLNRQLFELAKLAAAARGKLFDLSQQTGISVETLSALEIVAKTTGGSIETIVASLGIFQRKLEDTEDPASKASELFRELGVEVTDTEQTLRQTLLALASMPEGFKQTATALDLFGRGGKSILAILKETNGDLDAAIERFRDLGIIVSGDSAKAADEFNDQLVLVDAQLKAIRNTIGQEVMPVVLDLLRQFSDILKDNKEAIRTLGIAVELVARIFGEKFRQALNEVRTALVLLRPILEAVATIYERIKDAVEFIVNNPITGTPTPTTAGPAVSPTATTPTRPVEDQTTKALKEQLEARKRLLPVLESEAETRKRLANEQIAEAQRNFEAGKINRRQALDQTVEAARLQSKAVIDQLNNERRVQLETAALAKEGSEERKRASEAIFAIDTKTANERSRLRQVEQDEEAKFRKDELAQETEHQANLLKRAQERDAAEIALLQARAQRGAIAALDAENQIANIQNVALDREQAFLVRRLEAIGQESSEFQKIVDAIAAIDQRRTILAQEQSERRIQIALEEAQQLGEVAQGLIDDQLTRANTALRVGQITDESRIAATRALAALRVKTEEQAEREILQIHLAAIDREKELARIEEEAVNTRNQAEIQAVRARRRALDTELQGEPDLGRRTAIIKELTALTDAQINAEEKASADREKAERDRNNKTEILNAERKAIQAQGNRDIDDARQEDTENARRYAEDLQDINNRIADIERDAAEEVLRLMAIHFASRRDIIRARLQLDIEDENARHRNALQGIAALRQENAESNRTKQEKLEIEKEINRLAEAELRRHNLEIEVITAEGKAALEKADPIGRLSLGTDQLREFAVTIEDSIIPLGELLTSTFLQVADAIAQTVANWVLLGETGPAVMRKILAQALASIAAEAAVNAIKELALGFAMLFLNPAEAGAHFTAAALWASIGGVAAIAGRSVAGDLFKPKSSSAGRDSSPPRPLDTVVERGRNQQAPVVVHVDIKHEEGMIVRTWADDFNNGGISRQTVDRDGR